MTKNKYTRICPLCYSEINHFVGLASMPCKISVTFDSWWFDESDHAGLDGDGESYMCPKCLDGFTEQDIKDIKDPAKQRVLRKRVSVRAAKKIKKRAKKTAA